MTTTLLCIGPSHKTASLASRERFALVGKTGTALPDELLAHPDVLEVVSVATCNRSELYLAATDADRATTAAVASFARLAEADPEELSTMLAVRRDGAAVRHLFRVTAGAESVVVGEAQIQGQVRQALAAARESGTCGPLLDRLFRHALEVGKRVRTETALGAGHASVGSVAADLVQEALGSLHDRSVLLVGAGKMSALTAQSLRARGARWVVVANRNRQRAQALADQFAGSVADFDDIETQLQRCDVAICSTSAPHTVLTRERVQRVMHARQRRPLVLVDLAVPRDIESTAGEEPNCHLYDLDDLERLVSTSLSARESELDDAEGIVEQEAAAFLRWRRSLDVVPAIAQLRQHAEQVRARELLRFDAKFAHLAPEDRRRIDQLTRSFANKLLHHPTTRLRAAAEDEDGDPGSGGAHYASAVQHLFGLETVE